MTPENKILSDLAGAIDRAVGYLSDKNTSPQYQMPILLCDKCWAAVRTARKTIDGSVNIEYYCMNCREYPDSRVWSDEIEVRRK